MGKRFWGWLAFAVVVVFVIVLVVRGGDSSSEETGPIVIGGITPLSGDAAAYGIPDQRARMLAVEEINAAGGIDGRMLEVKWEDGKCNGTDATTAAQKLINVDMVKFILGGGCSSETLAAAALTEPANVLLLSALSTSPDITTVGEFVYRMYPSDAFAGQVMASYAAKDLGATRAAVISENTDFAQGLRRTFVASFTGEVVVNEVFETGETDFRTLATKVKEGDVDVVYVVAQTITSSTLVLKQLDEAGVDAVILGSDPMLDREAVAENAELYEGVVLPELAINEAAAKTSAFVTAYKAKYGEDLTFPGYQAAAYDSVYLLAEAMRAVGTDPEKVAEYFNTQVNDWEGAVGTFNFDENGDAQLQLNLRKITNGEITDMGPYVL